MRTALEVFMNRLPDAKPDVVQEIVNKYCPSQFGLTGNFDAKTGCKMDCEQCWGQKVLKAQVLDSDGKVMCQTTSPKVVDKVWDMIDKDVIEEDEGC